MWIDIFKKNEKKTCFLKKRVQLPSFDHSSKNVGEVKFTHAIYATSKCNNFRQKQYLLIPKKVPGSYDSTQLKTTEKVDFAIPSPLNVDNSLFWQRSQLML